MSTNEGNIMPKVYLTEKDRLCARLAKWVYGEMKVRRLTQEQVAKKMNISHQALSQKLKRESFDYADFVFFVKEFQPSNEELLQLIGI